MTSYTEIIMGGPIQVLIEDKKFQADLMALRTYAIENIVEITQENYKDQKPVGDNPRHVIKSGNIVIVYSIEKQPSGIYHHLSVSKDREKLPSVTLVDYLVKKMKISTALIVNTKIWQEENSINVLAPFHV